MISTSRWITTTLGRGLPPSSYPRDEETDGEMLRFCPYLGVSGREFTWVSRMQIYGVMSATFGCDLESVVHSVICLDVFTGRISSYSSLHLAVHPSNEYGAVPESALLRCDRCGVDMLIPVC